MFFNKSDKKIIDSLDNIIEYLNNKTVAEALPPMFKKIKRDVFKFNI